MVFIWNVCKGPEADIQMVHYPPHKLSRASRVELIS
jgi:hypothetical protein